MKLDKVKNIIDELVYSLELLGDDIESVIAIKKEIKDATTQDEKDSLLDDLDEMNNSINAYCESTLNNYSQIKDGLKKHIGE